MATASANSTSPNSVAATAGACGDEKTDTKLKLGSLNGYRPKGYTPEKVVPSKVVPSGVKGISSDEEDLPAQVPNPFSKPLCEDILPGKLSEKSIKRIAEDLYLCGADYSKKTLQEDGEDEHEIIKSNATYLKIKFNKIFDRGANRHTVWDTLTGQTNFRVFFNKAGALGTELALTFQEFLNDKHEKEKKALEKENRDLQIQVKGLRDRCGDLELLHQAHQLSANAWETERNVCGREIGRLKEEVHQLKKKRRAETSAETTAEKPAKKRRERPITPRRQNRPFKPPRPSSEHACGAAQ